MSAADDAQRGPKSAPTVRCAGVEKLRDLTKRLLGFWVLKGRVAAVVFEVVIGTIRKSSRCVSSEDSHSTNDDRTSRLATLKWFLPTVVAPTASANMEGWDLKTLTFSPPGTYAVFE